MKMSREMSLNGKKCLNVRQMLGTFKTWHSLHAEIFLFSCLCSKVTLSISHSFTLSRHAEQLKTFHSHSIEDLVLYKECPVKYVDMESGSKGDFLTSYQAWSKSGSQNNRISFQQAWSNLIDVFGIQSVFLLTLFVIVLPACRATTTTGAWWWRQRSRARHDDLNQVKTG